MLWALIAAALAAPVALPAGEDAEVWLDPLALHALAVGAPGDGAGVTLTAGETWSATVVRESGEVVTLTGLAPPTDERSREALASRLSSALQPLSFSLDVPEGPAAPAAPAAPAVAAIAETSAVEEIPAAPEIPENPEVSAAEPEPPAAVEPVVSAVEIIDLDTPEPEPGALDFWAQASGGASLRPLIDAGLTAQVLVGVSGQRWRVGVGGGLGSRMDLRAPSATRELSSAAVRAGALWSALGNERLGLEVGGVAELSRRRFYEGGELVALVTVPAVAPELDLWLVPIAPVGVGLFGRSWVDLRSGYIKVGEAAPTRFSPVAAEVGLLLAWR